MAFPSKFGMLLLVMLTSMLSVILPVSPSDDQPQKLVCYFGSWSNYRHRDGKFTVEDIDPFICTHLVYSFAKLEGNRIAAFDPYLDLKENWGKGAYEMFTGLKKANPNLKTILAIGGWNEGSVKYSKMAFSRSSRAEFVSSCVQFLLQYGFDGLDMDWEYPASRGGLPIDKSNFVLLLKELHEAFQIHDLSLSAAVSAGKSTIEAAYNIPEVSRYLDFINLMTYDLHGSWDPVTGHNSPLYPRPDDSEENRMLTVDYAVRFWISSGAPPEKIVLGMALYGRSFTLRDPKVNGIGAPAVGAGQAGIFTGEPGMLGYNEICYIMKSDSSWTVAFDEYYRSPYAYKGNQWVGYDNTESITEKVNYLKAMRLGGGMVWSIETDDFKGLCGGISYPLLTTIRRGLNAPWTAQSPRPTKAPPLRTTKVESTKEPADFTHSLSTQYTICPAEGYFRDPQDCRNFYVCSASPSHGYNVHLLTCPSGTAFSEKKNTCDHLVLVPECQDL